MPARAAEPTPDYSKASTEQLIDALTSIDQPAPGIDSLANFSAFLGDDDPPAFNVGVLGVPQPTVPPQMRELVRRGVSGLPALIAHLDDGRPTQLVVARGRSILRWIERGSEYDPRDRSSTSVAAFDEHRIGAVPPNGYVVKVADVCFVIVGQIVDRRLTAVRYQPTGGMVINSPLESPELRKMVEADWSGLDAAGHRASLLADLSAADEPWQWEAPLKRLRFYYPDTYRSLMGADAAKRSAFEMAKPNGR